MIDDRTLRAWLGLGPRTVALWGDVIRGTVLVVVLAVLGGLAVAYTHGLQNTVAFRHLQDFGLFYEGARLARAGGDLYGVTRLPGADRVRPYWNMNPPHFHLLVEPLTALSPPRAFAVWMILSGAALVGALVLIVRGLALSRSGAIGLGLLAVTWAPMMFTVMTGQVGLLLLVPFTLAWRRARQGRLAEAGAWIGVCASIKLFFLLFVLYFAVSRRWQALRMAVLAILAIFAAGFAVYGLPAYRGWIAHLSSVTWAEHYANASALGLVERTLSTSEWGQTPLADWPGVVGPLYLVVAGAIGVATLRRTRRSADEDRSFLLLTTAALLMSPLGWIYYAWFVLGPLAALVRRGDVLASRAGAGLLAVFTIAALVPPPVPWMTLTWGHGLWTVTLGSVYFWGMLALWLAQPAADVTAR